MTKHEAEKQRNILNQQYTALLNEERELAQEYYKKVKELQEKRKELYQQIKSIPGYYGSL